MFKKNHFTIILIFLLTLTLACCAQKKEEVGVASNNDYDALVSIFNEFFEFENPEVINGVPDYTKAIPEAPGRY